MSEFNLIDTAYLRRAQFKKWTVLLGIAYLGLVIVLALGKISLHDYISSAREEISSLQRDTETVLSRKRLLRDLQNQKAQLNNRLDVLEGLVEGPQISQIFYAVDRSLNDEIWFVDWSFRRAGEMVEIKPEEKDSGYFIIIPESGGQQNQAWKIRTHMEINAQAVNHTAMAKFVLNLGAQPEIEHVQIYSTSSQKVGNIDVVNFVLTVLLNTHNKDHA